MAATLTLMVLKTVRLDQLVAFYRALGLVFVEEKHDKGPVHFAAMFGELVLEIYPSKKDTTDSNLRLGFCVPNLRDVIAAFNAMGTPILVEHNDSAVVRDPDGRTIELRQSSTTN